MKCPGCGHDFRKGTLVTLMDGRTRTVARKRVCARCASGGVLVVAVAVPEVVRPASPAASFDVVKALRMLRTYAKTARMAGANEGDLTRPAELARSHQLGRAEGLESAIALLERGKDGAL